MKKLLVVAVIAGGLFWGYKKFVTKGESGSLPMFSHNSASPEAKARARVEKFMESWKKGGTSLNDAAQAAICQWARGVNFITDREDLNDAVTAFDRFRRAKDLYTDITSYSIQDGPAKRRTVEGRGTYTIFDVTINGTAHQLGVPDSANPIFWLD